MNTCIVTRNSRNQLFTSARLLDNLTWRFYLQNTFKKMHQHDTLSLSSSREHVCFDIVVWGKNDGTKENFPFFSAVFQCARVESCR